MNRSLWFNRDHIDLSVVDGVLLFVISVPSLFTNLAAILAAVRLLKVQPLSSNVFVLVLSCVDLAGLFCCSLPSWLVFIVGSWYGGRTVCFFQGFCLLFFSLYSGSLAMCMAIDRCIAVKKPFYHRKVMTIERSRNIILFITVLTFLISIPPLFAKDGFILSLCCTFCIINWFATNTAAVVMCNFYSALGGSFLLGSLACNASVIIALYKRKRQKISVTLMSCRLRSVARQKEEIERQFSKMMGLLSIVFAVCWGPFMVSNYVTNFIDFVYSFIFTSR